MLLTKRGNLMSDWKDIKVNFPEGEGFHPENPHFFKSRDASNRPLLVASFSEEISLDKLPNLRGIEPNLSQKEGGGSILSLALEDEINADKFSAVCMHIAEKTKALNGEMLVRRTLEELVSWSKLISPSRSGIPQHELIGLIGELYILQNYILPAKGSQVAINSWIGIEGAKQDFVFDDFSLEVKAHRSGFADKITISSAEQLHKQTQNLYLIKLDISTTDSSENISLSGLRESILSLLIDDPMYFDLFENSYLEKTEKASEEQLTSAFHETGLTLYEVNDSFPKLTPDNISEGIDLDSVNYRIERSFIDQFVVKESLDELLNKQ